MDKLTVLMRKIEHQFSDIELLRLALTHRSKGAQNYERLEFLGDSILGFVVAELLYKKFPGLAEGKLSRMRSSLVRKETLAAVARDIGMSDYLILGEGELKSGGFNRDSILADTIESMIGALYLDNGFDTARRFIYTNFETQFDAVSEQSTFKDPKSRLQETMQKQGLQLPSYEIIDTAGVQHDQQFTVECSLVDMPISSQATAHSRRSAEQRAAEQVLEIVNNDDSNRKNAD